MQAKRHNAVLLVMLMCLLAIVGCGKPNASSEGTAAGTPAAATKSAAPAPAEPVKLSLFISGNGYPQTSDDVILQELNKRLNMNLDFQVSELDYGEQLNVRVAGGTPPDIFRVGKSNLIQFSEQDVLLNLDPYLDKLPNTVALIEKYANINIGKVDGKLMGLPKIPYLPSSMLFIRQDWLDRLGLKKPTNLEELKEVATAFANRDPDNNGKKDTYGITGSEDLGGFEPIFSAFGIGGIYGDFSIRDNQLVYSMADPAMKEALAYLKELQEAGAFDPELIANKGVKHHENAFKGQSGIIYMHWADRTKNLQQIAEINPNADWTYIDTLTGPGGAYIGAYDNGSTEFLTLSKSLESNPEKLNKALEYLDYISTDEGKNLVYFGIEDTHYKIVDGQAEMLPAITETSYAFNHQLFGRDDLAYLSAKFVTDRATIQQAISLPRVRTYNSIIPIPSEINVADMQRYQLESAIAFIYGKKPLDQFEAYVNTLNTTYKLLVYAEQAEQALKELGELK